MFGLRCVIVIWTFILTNGAVSDSLMAKQYLIHKDRRTWNEARAICENEGGCLAMLDNKATMEALLAFSKLSVWINAMTSSFWIGLNKDGSSSTEFRWDHCEEYNSSFDFWEMGEPKNPENSHCVLGTRAFLKWKSEMCNNQAQYVCEIETGLCSYTIVSGTCPSAQLNSTYSWTKDTQCEGECNTESSNELTQSQCQDKCSTELNNDLACWMYSYSDGSCTLYFDADPETCSPPAGGSQIAGIRSCFRYDVTTSDSSVSHPETTPLIECNNITTQQVSSVSTTTSSQADETVTTEYTPETTNVTPLPNETSTASNQVVTGSYQTINTTPFIDEASTTDQTKVTETQRTDSSSSPRPSTTVTTTPYPPTTTTTTTAASSTTAVPSSESPVCPCWQCVPVKNLTEVQQMVYTLLLVDKTRLSAFRRRKESASDDRPSAQALGYTGILFIVFTLSIFVIIDMMRFCQLSVDGKCKY